MVKIRQINQNRTYGKIYLHSMPGRYEKFDEFEKEVKKLNLYKIVCLTDTTEIEEKSPEYLPSINNGKLNNTLINYNPVPDYSIPTKVNDFLDYELTLIMSYQALMAGNILIHCAGGIGRTGTFAVILLQIIGFSFKEALKITQEAGSNPETPEQLEFCRYYNCNSKIYEKFPNTKLDSKKEYRSAKEIAYNIFPIVKQGKINKKVYTGIKTGLTNIDNMINGFKNSELIIIGARHYVGKTALAITMAANIAVRNKIPVGFFTLGISEEILVNRLLSCESQIGSEKLQSGTLNTNELKKIVEASERIYKAPLYINDTQNIKLIELNNQARKMQIKEGVKIIFIDYIGLIEIENECKISRHEQLAEISGFLKSLARDLNIPIVCLSHLCRLSKNKPPSLANLRKLGPIDKDADVVLFLHRDSYSETSIDQSRDPLHISTELIIAKQRNGFLGTIPIVFLPKYSRFENFSRDSS